jgi:hypothetical protein
MSAYRPFDQEEKLGPPPWGALDEKVALWERAHGHDVRLKCSPDFGCQVIEGDAYDRGWDAGFAEGYLAGRRDVTNAMLAMPEAAS